MNSHLSNDERKEVGVYIIHNPITDETYIGSGILGRRLYTHNSLLEKNKHYNYKLQQAYNRNSNFEFIPVVVDGSREESLAFEQLLINEHWGNPLLLNILQNVDHPMLGFKQSEEAIEKNRQATLSRWKDSEFREKVIAAQKAGRAKMSPEEESNRINNLRNTLKESYANGSRQSNAGQTRSEEFCQNNSLKISEKWKDPEYRERQHLARINSNNINRQGKEVIVGDVIFPSLTTAGKDHGITKQAAKYRIESNNYPDWNYKS